MCGQAFFRKFEEAVEHEELCQQILDRKNAIKAHKEADMKYQKERAARMSALLNVNVDIKGDENRNMLSSHVSPLKPSNWDNHSTARIQSNQGDVIVLDLDSSDHLQEEIPTAPNNNSTPNEGVHIASTPESNKGPSVEGRSKFTRFITDSEHSDLLKLSKLNRTFVSSLDMYEYKPLNKGTRIAFCCHFCGRSLALKSRITVKALANELPKIAFEHFKKCAMNKELRQSMSTINNWDSVKDDGNLNFYDFFMAYCTRHNIIDMHNGGVQRLTKKSGENLSQTDETIEHDINQTVRAAKELNADDVISVYNSTIESLLVRKKRSIINTEEQTMPFVAEEFAHLLDYLSPYHKIILNESSLILSKTNEDTPSGYRAVCIECNHCSAKKALCDLRKWDKILLTFSMLHHGGSCKAIPLDVKSNLSRQREDSRAVLGKPNNPFLSFGKLCDCVAIYYNFEDSKAIQKGTDGKVLVKFDNSSNGTYKRKSSIESDVSHKRKSSIESDVSHKRCKVELGLASLVRNAIRRPSADDNSLKSTRNIKVSASAEDDNVPPLVYHAQNGVETHLIPFGGVPLDCTLTKSIVSPLLQCHKALVKNLEFFEGKNKEVFLRCNNCNSDPSGGWSKALTSKKDIYRQVMLSHIHFKDCNNTPSTECDVIKTVGGTFSSSSDDPMRKYCLHLVDTFGLVSNDEKTRVLFSDCDMK